MSEIKFKPPERKVRITGMKILSTGKKFNEYYKKVLV